MNDNPIKNYSPDSDNSGVRKFSFPNSDQVAQSGEMESSLMQSKSSQDSVGQSINSGNTNSTSPDGHLHKSLKDMVKEHAHSDSIDLMKPVIDGPVNDKPVVHIVDALNAETSDQSSERNIRTYQSDISSAVKNDNVTMIKIALAEKKRQDKMGSMDQIAQENKNIKFTVITSAVVLLFVGLVATALYVFTKSPSIPIGTPTATNPNPSIIYAEENTFINVDDRTAQEIIRLTQIEKTKEIDLGSLKYVLYTTGIGTSSRPVTTGEFFDATNSRVTSALVRSLKSNFMLGIYAKNPYESFAIFNVDFYDGAFAEMLKWESTLERDLGGIFISTENLQRMDVKNTPSTEEGGAIVSTSTNLIDSSFTKNVFVDMVVENKDSRALIDSEGRILMLYTFVDKETLVIATSDKTLREVLFRLTAGRIVR
jgi:hypothetical protein